HWNTLSQRRNHGKASAALAQNASGSLAASSRQRCTSGLIKSIRPPSGGRAYKNERRAGNARLLYRQAAGLSNYCASYPAGKIARSFSTRMRGMPPIEASAQEKQEL